MDVSNVVSKITSEKEDERVNFNELPEAEVADFKAAFLNESEDKQVEYLSRIIEETDESQLMNGQMKAWLDEPVIRELLHKCV